MREMNVFMVCEGMVSRSSPRGPHSQEDPRWMRR